MFTLFEKIIQHLENSIMFSRSWWWHLKKRRWLTKLTTDRVFNALPFRSIDHHVRWPYQRCVCRHERPQPTGGHLADKCPHLDIQPLPDWLSVSGRQIDWYPKMMIKYNVCAHLICLFMMMICSAWGKHSQGRFLIIYRGTLTEAHLHSKLVSPLQI